jgi:hypothetical protein
MNVINTEVYFSDLFKLKNECVFFSTKKRECVGKGRQTRTCWYLKHLFTR